MNLQEAKELVEQIEVLETELKVHKESLKKFFKENPNEVVQGKYTQYTYKTVTSYTTQPHKVVELLKLIASNGVNPYEYVKVSVTDLLKLEADWFKEDEVVKFAIPKYSNRLTATKVK